MIALSDILTMLAISLVVGMMSFIVTYYLKDMDGPLEIFREIRLAIRATELIHNAVHDEYVESFKDSFFGKLFECFWCLTTWVTAALSIAAIFVGRTPVWWFVCVWLIAVTISGAIYNKLS